MQRVGPGNEMFVISVVWGSSHKTNLMELYWVFFYLVYVKNFNLYYNRAKFVVSSLGFLDKINITTDLQIVAKKLYILHDSIYSLSITDYGNPMKPFFIEIPNKSLCLGKQFE